LPILFWGYYDHAHCFLPQETFSGVGTLYFGFVGHFQQKFASHHFCHAEHGLSVTYPMLHVAKIFEKYLFV